MKIYTTLYNSTRYIAAFFCIVILCTCSLKNTTVPSINDTNIVFVSNRDGNEEIYTMNLSGDNISRLTFKSAIDTDPAWSPDGQWITFVSDRSGNTEIYVMYKDGKNLSMITNGDNIKAKPAWPPDGQHIVFVMQNNNDPSTAEIYMIDKNGKGQSRLSNNTFFDYAPVWSPDGKKIAFETNRDGNLEIYTMNIDGSNISRLTNNLAADIDPAWSPNGKYIAFASTRDLSGCVLNCVSSIYTMQSDGKDPTRITWPSVGDEPGDLWPTWSPDGQYIAFQHNLRSCSFLCFSGTRKTNYEIYLVKKDGVNQLRLTNTTAFDGIPNWSLK